ncbi:phosphodiester glycosidase family protein [Haploplasma axanthum]|uniref:Exopolysaccharide biosynthesis protein related to N-acetylglucosamine-1-phosphodiester alpha-N-acetylglucosaminidase n=1 Tax=Haploplasma axanthum TaxID=29552 RepID=A0A449BBJ8_HAPAX|nr:phosphodiester glycosidase family protein [Haploplasma axanthum]VEU79789.1 Exopolysaccharide biosynthesis protein related to N-acetylglucosamine-1-phosphodiester alpha-N-acetylglucosaminidase [Haploplasma axanthum]
MKKILMMLLITTTLSLSATNLKYNETRNDVKDLSGVTYSDISGNVTNDANTTTNQEVRLFEKNEDIEVVTWSKFSNGKYVKADTLEIANDFESNNSNYEVIAGVNGDYFLADQTVNANVIYGNRVIKPNNHIKYQALEIDMNGNKVKNHVTTTSSSKILITIFDNNDSAYYYDQIKGINNPVLYDNETTVISNSIKLLDTEIQYYTLTNSKIHVIGSHLYVEGTATLGFQSSGYVIATKNKEIINIIENKNIIVQNEISNVQKNNMLIGYDSLIMEKGIIKEFEEIKGQSESNNKSRHPRTGFGYDINGNIKLITVDGRNPGVSNGVNLREFAQIMKSYGIVEGYNLDGGGSTQAVARIDNKLQMVNNPSDNPFRKVGNALLFVKRKHNIKANLTNVDGLINITVNGDTSITKLNILVNGVEKEYNFGDKIEFLLPLNRKSVVSVNVVYNDNGITKKGLIKNYYLESTKIDIPDKPGVNVEHKYVNNNLTITLNYKDPNKLISDIRVKIVGLDKELPALIQSAEKRQTTFENVEIRNEDELIIIVKYSDGTISEKEYIVIIKEKISNNNIYVYILIVIFAILVSALPFFLIKKRKRLQ